MQAYRTKLILFASGLALAACNNLPGQTPAANTAAPTANAAAPVTPAPAPAPAAPAGPSAAVSGAAQQNFSVLNSTSKTVYTLHVSSVSNQNWGPDILGQAVIQPGATASVTFPRAEAQCNWDIRAVYTDNTDAQLRGVNLCQVATVTLVEN